ncbi:MAG TPA: flippase [Flavitalea sp.]|nr:flippase [Flavitalea sp.]
MAVDAGVQPVRKAGVLKNVFSIGIVQVANYVFPLLTLPYVSRIIGPDKLGVINFAAAFVVYFVLLINFGFDLTATRAIASNRSNLEERNRIFNLVLLAKSLMLAISIVIFVVLLFAMPQFREEKATAIFSFLVCFAWVITPNWLFQGMQELTRVAIFNLAAKTIFTILIFVFIREKVDYVWQPLAVSIAQIGVGVYSFVYAIKRYKITLKRPKTKDALNLLWKERIIFFSSVVVNLYTTTNVVLLGFLQTAEQVGYYTAGWRLILIAQQMISVPISQALFPYIGAAFSESRDRGIDIVRQLFPIITAITIAASIALYFLGPLTILIVYGEAFEPAVPAFQTLAFIPIIIGWNNLLGIQTMINLKMDRSFFRITTLGAVISLALNFLLVTRLGFIGSAWSWLLTEMLITGSMFFVLYRMGINMIEKKYFTANHFVRFLKPIILIIQQKIKK